MKKVYSSDNYLLAGHLRQVLENHDIECIERNEFLIGGAGELPPTECWPELWVIEDSQYEKAKALIQSFLETSPHSGKDWVCEQCGERLEGQFTQCWRCGAEKPLQLD